MLVNELSFMPQLPKAKYPNFSQCNTSRGCRRLFSNWILLVLQLKETSNGLNLMSCLTVIMKLCLVNYWSNNLTFLCWKSAVDNKGVISPWSGYHRDNTLHQKNLHFTFKPINQIFNENFHLVCESINGIQRGLKLDILLNFFLLIGLNINTFDINIMLT